MKHCVYFLALLVIPTAARRYAGSEEQSSLSVVPELDAKLRGGPPSTQAIHWQPPPLLRTRLHVVTVGLALGLPVALWFSLRLWWCRSDSIAAHTTSQPVAMGVLAIYVVLLLVFDMLTSYTAQKHGGHYPWVPMVLVFIVEMSKTLVSLCLYVKEGQHPRLDTLRMVALCLVPVSALYAGNNCFVYFLLSHVDLSSYVIWRNTTILFNAVLWTRVMGRSLRLEQWVAVLFLFAGCCMSSLKVDGSLSEIVGWEMAYFMFSAFMSSLAAVLNESVLKQEAFKDLGVNCMNVVMYSLSCLFMAIVLLSQVLRADEPLLEIGSLVSNLDASAAALITVQTLLGLTVSRVLVHATSVSKTMAGGAREIFTVALAPLFVKSRFDWISMSSALWIGSAIISYSSPPPDTAGRSTVMDKSRKLGGCESSTDPSKLVDAN